MLMIMMAAKVSMLSWLFSVGRLSIAFFEIFKTSRRIGRIIGKPKMAIKVELLDALEAMLEMVVKEAANPNAPKKEPMINVVKFCIGLPKTME